MSDFNTAPEGLKEITPQEFYRILYGYQTKQKDIRQVREFEATFNLAMFDVDTDFVADKIGVAIMEDWFDEEEGKNRDNPIIRFCRYGVSSSWKTFTNKFAAQFAGDNS